MRRGPKTVVVNHHVREDQYEWLRQYGNSSIVMRELIDAAMCDPRFLRGSLLARLHRLVRELDGVLTELRAESDVLARERQGRASRRRGGRRELPEG
jgi:hypothetical protein